MYDAVSGQHGFNVFVPFDEDTMFSYEARTRYEQRQAELRLRTSRASDEASEICRQREAALSTAVADMKLLRKRQRERAKLKAQYPGVANKQRKRR
jgi:hypothetical protein